MFLIPDRLITTNGSKEIQIYFVLNPDVEANDGETRNNEARCRATKVPLNRGPISIFFRVLYETL